MKNLLSKTGIAIGGLCVAGALPASADVLYNNLSGGAGSRVGVGTTMLGDQIALSGSSSLYDLTKFTFQYWGNSTDGVNFIGVGGQKVQVQLTFFANDGALAKDENGIDIPASSTPSSLLWQSSWYDIDLPVAGADGDHSASLAYDIADFGALQVPSIFTWAVQFKNLDTTDSAGVYNLGNGPVGASDPDYWVNNGGTWNLMHYQNGATPVNFGATLEGTAVVPEPSSMALLGLGGLGLMALAKRSRRQE